MPNRHSRELDKPFPPGSYDVVVVGSEPSGMFRRFPIFQRLISWTKPQAPVARGTREYEWYDHNSLLAEEPEHRALVPDFMDRAFDLPSREEMEAAMRAATATSSC